MPHPDAKTALALALRDALSTTPRSKVTVSGLTRTAVRRFIIIFPTFVT